MTQLLQNAVYGAVMIAAVAALRGALKDRLIPEARLALWAVCLFRLFTPAAPASVLSFWGLLGRGTKEISAPAPGPVPAPNAGPFVSAAAVGTAPAVPAEAGMPWGTVLAAVWIAVGFALAARYALAYARTCRAVRRTVLLGREDARYAALPKCARLREGALDGAPLTFGVARPTVVLTPGLDGAELACVLAHEGVHARRRDNLWHYAMAAALTVFWWNPAVWLMARLMRRDVELSCDRAAVRRLGEDRRAEYANTLVSMAAQGKDPAFCQTFGRKAAEERIISVMKYKKTTVTGAALTMALVLAVTVGFASDPDAGLPDEESATSSAPAPFMWMCYSDSNSDGKVLGGSIGLDYLEQLLADHVADGSMTQEDAAYYLAAAEAMSQDGVKLDWKAPRDIELFTDGPRHRESGRIVPYVYYMDEGGNKVCLDPVEMLTAYVVLVPVDAPSGSGLFIDPGEEEPGFVSYDSTSDPAVMLKEYKAVLDRAVARGERTQAEADEMLARMDALIERAKSREIEGLMFTKQGGEVSYTEAPDEQAPICTLPTYVEVCPVEGCTALGTHTHDGHDRTVYLCSGAGHEGGVCDGSCYVNFNGGMADIYIENGYPVDENGYALDYGEDGELFMKTRWGALPCIRTDCAISAGHYHKYGEVIYTYDNTPALLCIRPSCSETGIHEHDGMTYKAIVNICTRTDCGNTGIHEHDGVTYKGWRGKISMPAPICAREDCTVSGAHWHENGEVVHFYYAYDEPVGCPPEAIDKDFFQRYPEANYQNFEHHESESGHHSDSHH